MSTALESALLPVYPPPRIGFAEGDGVWLTGTDGVRYLDFAAGIAVVSLGHRHPAPLAAASRGGADWRRRPRSGAGRGARRPRPLACQRVWRRG